MSRGPQSCKTFVTKCHTGILYSVRQHAQKSLAFSASSASVEVSWAFCGWPCHSLFATLWTQGFLRRSRKIGMHHWNASAKKPLHYILDIFPWKGSIGSWVKDLPVTHFQNNFWLLNPLIFIPSQNPLNISLIHALYTTVNFLRANGGGTKLPDPVLQLPGPDSMRVLGYRLMDFWTTRRAGRRSLSTVPRSFSSHAHPRIQKGRISSLPSLALLFLDHDHDQPLTSYSGACTIAARQWQAGHQAIRFRQLGLWPRKARGDCARN